MTIRAPLSTRVGTRGPPVSLLTWTTSAGALQRTFVLRQLDWPNPAPKRPDLTLRTWTQGLPPGVIANPVPTPIRQLDWPNPQPKKPFLDNLGWEFWQQIPQPATSAPFVRTDWPNPLRRAARADLLTWTDGFPFGAINLSPRAKDWPNPVRAKAPTQVWLQTQLPMFPTPFAPAQWPNPTVKAVSFERTWTQGLPPGSLAATTTLPPHTYDWPNPALPEPSYDLRGWSQSLRLSARLVTVPDVLGETESAAQADIAADELVPVALPADYSDTVAAGLVMSQSPAGGNLVELNTSVSYVISLGPRPVGLPKFYRRYRGYDARVQRGDRKPRR